MDPDRLAKRKNTAPEQPHILAIGRLLNYKPRFSRYSMINKGGVLDIVKFENSCVYGIIYGIKKKYLHLIDKAEGVPNYYRKITVNVYIDQLIDKDFKILEFSNDNSLNCYCYEVINKELLEIPPSRAYMEHVRIGYKRYKVNIDQIENIIKRIGYYENNN